MEKTPDIRVVGKLSEEDKDKVKKFYKAMINNHADSFSEELLEALKKYEQEKNPEPVEIIKIANDESNKLLEECGVSPYNIPVGNVHIISDSVYKEFNFGSGDAHAKHNLQTVFVNADKSYPKGGLYFASVIFHEFMHLKGHYAVHAQKNENKIKSEIFRQGIDVYTLSQNKNEHTHFRGLNEAIVHSQDKNFMTKILEMHIFEEEKKWRASGEWKKISAGICQDTGILSDEIKSIIQNKDGTFQYFYYPFYCRILKYICEEIAKQMPNKYPNAEKVNSEFLKSHFSGKLLSLAHIIEETFGKGSFRMLGDIEPEYKSQLNIEILEKLKKMREGMTNTQ